MTIVNPIIGWGADLKVLIAEVAVNSKLMTSVTLELDEGKHDLVKIRMSGLPHRAVTDYRNAPVRIEYSTGGNLYWEFHGYIEEVRPDTVARHGIVRGSLLQDATLMCFGVSYAMRGKRSKSWGSLPLHEVVSQLAHDYRFSCSVPEGSPRFDNLLQQDESDFEFLSRVVTDHGYSMSVHNTHIDVWDPYQALERSKGLFYLNTIKTVRRLNPAPGQIISFHGSFGRHSPDGNYKNTEVTVMDKRGVTFEVSASDVFSCATSDFPNRQTAIVDSYGEAEVALQAAKRSAYDYTAKVQTLGVASAVPGTVVDVQGFNTDYDGYWYVRGVKHVITTGVFTTDFDLARNIESQFSPTVVDRYRTPPTTSYVGGKWQASRLKSTIYA